MSLLAGDGDDLDEKTNRFLWIFTGLFFGLPMFIGGSYFILYFIYHLIKMGLYHLMGWPFK
jgi:hypothetical protein